MGDVGDCVTSHWSVLKAENVDSVIVLHFGECASDNVGGFDWLRPLARSRGTGNNQQALCVSTHASRHVIKVEQLLQLVGVLLVVLEFGDHAQHPLQKLLVTATEVHEHLRNVAAASGLLDSEVECGQLHVVKGVHQRAELVVAFPWQRLQAHVGVTRTNGPKLRNDGGQVVVCDLFCTGE